MVSAFFFSFFLSLINDVNFCSCTQDIMKGRRVYFDQFFACVALSSYLLMGNIVIRDQLQHKGLKLRLFS